MKATESGNNSVQLNNVSNPFEKHPKLTMILFVVILLVIIDLIVGTIVLTKPEDHKGRIYNDYFNHTLVPNFSGTDLWLGNYTLYTNNLGFKDKAVRDVPLTTDKHRIVFIGDSFTEGIGIPYDKTWVGLLDEKLSPQGYDILNAGEAGYSPMIYYYKMKYFIEHGLKMNEIVAFIDLSDVQNELAYQYWKPTTPSFLRTFWEDTTHNIDFFLEHHSLIYLHIIRPTIFGDHERRLYALLTGEPVVSQKEVKYLADMGRWTFDDEVYNDWGKDGVALELSYMNKLADLAKKNNIKLSVAVYPWPVTIENKDLNSRDVTIWKNFANSHNTDLYNFFPVFIATTTPFKKEYDTYFIPNDTHWNVNGHQVVAQEWLRQYMENNKK